MGRSLQLLLDSAQAILKHLVLPQRLLLSLQWLPLPPPLPSFLPALLVLGSESSTLLLRHTLSTKMEWLCFCVCLFLRQSSFLA